MSITLKIIDKKGDVREVIVEAGETLELQTGEKIDISTGDNLELVMAGGDLIVGDGSIEILVTNFMSSGGIVSGGQTITAQQAATGQSSRVEVAETMVEAESSEITPTISQPSQLETVEFEGVDQFYDNQTDIDALGSNQATGNTDDSEASQQSDTETSATESTTNTILPLGLTVTSTLTATEEQSFSYTIPEATGGEGNNIYTVTLSNGEALPGWLTFNANTRTLSGTPDDADLQSLDLTIIVSGAQGDLNPASVNTTLGVVGVNDAPVVSFSASTSYDNASSLFGDISITDADLSSSVKSATVTLTKFAKGDRLAVDLTDATGNSSNIDLDWDFKNGVLILRGDASADVYEAALSRVYLIPADADDTDRTLEVKVQDDKDDWSTAGETTVTLSSATKLELTEDQLAEQVTEEGGAQYEVGNWLPDETSGKITSVVMRFGGADYPRDIEDISNGNYFKFTIGTPELGTLGGIYFNENGTITMKPTDNINVLPVGYSLEGRFTYTVENAGQTTVYTKGMSITGANDAPVVEFSTSDSYSNASSLFGDISITDVDSGSSVKSATVTLMDYQVGDRLAADLTNATGNSSQIDLGWNFDDSTRVLTLTGNASAEVYEAALSRVYLIPAGDGDNNRTLKVKVQDDKDDWSTAGETTVTLSSATKLELTEDQLAEQVTEEGGAQYEVGNWLPDDTSGKITSVVMRFGGADYPRDIEDISNGNYFKFTIGTPELGTLGGIYFNADGSITMKPTDNINVLPEGYSLEGRFTYTVENAGQTTVYTKDMSITGNGEAATGISIGGEPITIKSSVENGYELGKITVTDDTDGFVFNDGDSWKVFEQISDDPLKASTAFNIIEKDGEYHLVVADSTLLADMEGSVNLVLALTDEGAVVEQPVTVGITNYDTLNINAEAYVSLFSYLDNKGDGIEEVTLLNTGLTFTINDVISITDDDNVLYISNAGYSDSSYILSGSAWSLESAETIDNITWAHLTGMQEGNSVDLYIEQNLMST